MLYEVITLVLLQEVEKLKLAVDEELQRQSTGVLWGKPALQLMQLPGVGYIVAMTVLSAIGDISRFESAKKLVGYAGMGAGRITSYNVCYTKLLRFDNAKCSP